MRYFFVLAVFQFFSAFGYCQSNYFGGTYAYGNSAEIGPIGILYIYPKTDTALLFYLDLNIGPPSNNSGSLLGLLTINHKQEADFIEIDEFEFVNCSLQFIFKNNLVLIKTINDRFQCGFGHSVFADGSYEKIKFEMPEFFIDGTGEKVFFKELD
jgi:hypothetical protein